MLYFESENELTFYNLEARFSMREICGSNEGDQVLNEGDLWLE